MNFNDTADKLNALRKRMRQENVALYMISSSDFHMSEEPSAYFRAVEYISGFTGTPAYMVITETNAHLWTDGRYAIQARRELEGSGIKLHISSDLKDEIRTLSLFFEASGDALLDMLIEESELTGTIGQEESKYVIGFDGRTFAYSLVDEILDDMGIAFGSGVVVINAKLDLIGDIWKNRPMLPNNKIGVLDVKKAGVAVSNKLKRIRANLDEYGPDTGLVLTSLGDIAWLYNIRGMDCESDMTALSYAYINEKRAYIFIDKRKLTAKVKQHFSTYNVTIKAYDEFYTFLENVEDDFVLVDSERDNSAVVVTIGDRDDVTMLNSEGMIEALRTVKNLSERELAEEAGVCDAVAMIRFIKWIKENVGKVLIDELSAGEYLDLLRKKAGALRPSFRTICAYGENAAIIHYTATGDRNSRIDPKGLLLVDSGGHYEGATTDVTRTIALGPVPDEVKKNYTFTLSAMLELGAAEFRSGVTDAQADIVAREQVWKHGLDYDHSTGHGVGAMLSVHEEPINISWQKRKRRSVLVPGMIMSNEPGCYKEGEYGIRHENMMVCREEKSGFIGFRYLTFVPFDTSAIDRNCLSEHQRNLLNEYHKNVYDRVSERLDTDEREWLCEQTRPI